ncbi:uncharacterized protein LOC125238796 [Leguminivora glycinivorella]|uniref:uncharacterized protein LOC125238796 n=1 Tax=Leguminivora glycinivorella TaxID=1035111 RepID=UPI00200E64D6|nr:uncharacterized protein LOC125238796 [Leguminivora glycinivorella]
MKHFLIFIWVIPLTLSEFDYGNKGDLLDVQWYDNGVKNCKPGSISDSNGFGRSICRLSAKRNKKNKNKKKIKDILGAHKKEKCTATGRFKGPDECNWCFCDKGATFCTAMRCEKKTNKTKLMTDIETCANKPMGRFKSEDGCNWCYCVDTNTPICSDIECVKILSKPKALSKTRDSNVCRAKERKPGRYLNLDGCNWCYCISWHPFCTIIKCPKHTGSSDNDVQTQFIFRSGNLNYVSSGSYTIITLTAGSKNSSSTDFQTKSILPDSFQDFGKKFFNGTNPFKPDEHSSNINYEAYRYLSGKEKKLNKKGLKVPKKFNWFPDYTNLDYTDNLLPKKMALKRKLKLKSLKGLAQECKAGSKFKDPFGCNWCTCIEDGVVICDNDDCGTKINN